MLAVPLLELYWQMEVAYVKKCATFFLLAHEHRHWADILKLTTWENMKNFCKYDAKRNDFYSHQSIATFSVIITLAVTKAGALVDMT